MVRFQLLLSLVVLSSSLTACVPSSNQNADLEVKPETAGIIGGSHITENDVLPRSVVAIYDANEGQLCSGTLIAKRIILTAAHCVGSDISQMYVFFGDNLDADSSAYVPVEKAEVSPYWKSLGIFSTADMGDVALLKISHAAPEPYVPAQFLPSSLAALLKDGSDVIVAGFGVTDGPTEEGAKVLRKAQVKIANSSYARSEILVDQTAGEGVCHGDSGGPAFIEISGKYYLWGLTSRGVNDVKGTCSQYAAFTKISYHRAWIERMMAKLSTSLVDWDR